MTTPEKIHGLPTMAEFPDSVDALLDPLLTRDLTPGERAVRGRVRAWATTVLAPVVAEHWERATFPYEVLPSFAALGLGGGDVFGPRKMSKMALAMVATELARVDASFATFYLVHCGLAMESILACGSEEQKARFLPALADFKTVGAFALTEPDFGSDATSLQTVASPCPGGFHLSGAKRWIGNAPLAGVVVVWARHAVTGSLGAYVLELNGGGRRATSGACGACGGCGGTCSNCGSCDGPHCCRSGGDGGGCRRQSGACGGDATTTWGGLPTGPHPPSPLPGLTVSTIPRKAALRLVQNADLALDQVFVPSRNALPVQADFAADVGLPSVLAASRVLVAWLPVGVLHGALDLTLRYVQARRQFGAPLASFQLVQERLARISGSLVAMWTLCERLTRAGSDGDGDGGFPSPGPSKAATGAAVQAATGAAVVGMPHVALAKAWSTREGRACVALCRELLGGNGIVLDFGVAKAFCDLEALYTYEGSYDVNALVAGRFLTGGLAAFKPPAAAAKAKGAAAGSSRSRL